MSQPRQLRKGYPCFERWNSNVGVHDRIALLKECLLFSFAIYKDATPPE